MAEQLVIEAPDFDDIEKRAGRATRDAVNLLWSVLNQEISVRRRLLTDAVQNIEPKALNSAPAAQQDNFDAGRVGIFYFTGAAAFNLTGIRNGIEGKIIFFHNTGAGTVTIVNNSGASDAANRILTSTAANKSLTTDQSIMFFYLSQRWREYKPL